MLFYCVLFTVISQSFVGKKKPLWYEKHPRVLRLGKMQFTILIDSCSCRKWNSDDYYCWVQVNATSWPYMTFDLNIWPLTSLTYEGSHVASTTRVLLQVILVRYISARGFLHELRIFQTCIFLYSSMYTTLFKGLYSLYYICLQDWIWYIWYTMQK